VDLHGAIQSGHTPNENDGFRHCISVGPTCQRQEETDAGDSYLDDYVEFVGEGLVNSSNTSYS
jgi:hypothetical protein